MGCYVLGFQEINQTQVSVIGGKGAHLGELSRIEGLRVPVGFGVTTGAFQRIMAEAPSIDDRLDGLSRLKPVDREATRALSAEIRRTLEGIAIPDDLVAAITRPLARLSHPGYVSVGPNQRANSAQSLCNRKSTVAVTPSLAAAALWPARSNDLPSRLNFGRYCARHLHDLLRRRASIGTNRVDSPDPRLRPRTPESDRRASRERHRFFARHRR